MEIDSAGTRCVSRWFLYLRASMVDVYRRPRVRLAIMVNELLPSGSRPHGYRIADANGPMLARSFVRDAAWSIFPV